MIPLLPFALGLLGGAAAVGLLRNKQTRGGLVSARTRLCEATVSGLAAAERSSARLRERLAPNMEEVAAPESVTPAAPDATVSVAAEAKPPRKRAPRKPGMAEKPAASRTGSRRKAVSGGDQ